MCVRTQIIKVLLCQRKSLPQFAICVGLQQGCDHVSERVVGGLGGWRGIVLDMEILSEGSISAISEMMYRILFSEYSLSPTLVCLGSYNNGALHLCGTIGVLVQVKSNELKELDLFVVPNGGQPL
ncbi:hypothetical protein PR048_014421 [Dryococelus australis]|uniref:Uncharacterized protein n=1 Tax=Dryococelus australis TaxID=614101 RepID=A0ABQ9HED6_9NEOP|nr:hypothetical protein PR048_014421 [Dryococelus australis]